VTKGSHLYKLICTGSRALKELEIDKETPPANYG
jgi:hypothetical protein